MVSSIFVYPCCSSEVVVIGDPFTFNLVGTLRQRVDHLTDFTFVTVMVHRRSYSVDRESVYDHPYVSLHR